MKQMYILEGTKVTSVIMNGEKTKPFIAPEHIAIETFPESSIVEFEYNGNSYSGIVGKHNRASQALVDTRVRLDKATKETDMKLQELLEIMNDDFVNEVLNDLAQRGNK